MVKAEAPPSFCRFCRPISLRCFGFLIDFHKVLPFAPLVLVLFPLPLQLEMPIACTLIPPPFVDFPLRITVSVRSLNSFGCCVFPTAAVRRSCESFCLRKLQESCLSPIFSLTPHPSGRVLRLGTSPRLRTFEQIASRLPASPNIRSGSWPGFSSSFLAAFY